LKWTKTVGGFSKEVNRPNPVFCWQTISLIISVNQFEYNVYVFLKSTPKMTCLKTKMECWFQFIPVFLQHFIHLQLPCPYFFCSAQKLSFLKPSYVDPNFGRVAPNTSGQGTGYKGLEQMVDFGRVPFELS